MGVAGGVGISMEGLRHFVQLDGELRRFQAGVGEVWGVGGGGPPHTESPSPPPLPPYTGWVLHPPRLHLTPLSPPWAAQVEHNRQLVATDVELSKLSFLAASNAKLQEQLSRAAMKAENDRHDLRRWGEREGMRGGACGGGREDRYDLRNYGGTVGRGERGS